MSGLPNLHRSLSSLRRAGVLTRLARLSTLLLLVGALLALGWGLQPVGATDSGAAGPARSEPETAPAGFVSAGLNSSSIPPAVSPGAERIAVKLAPGYTIQTRSDGTLLVVQDRGGRAAAAVDIPGVALDQVGEVGSLDVQVVELAPEGVQAAGMSAASHAGELDAAVEALRLTPGVLWAEAGHPVYACLTPDDPLYPPSVWDPAGQWGLVRVGLPAAWDIETGSADVVVAVVDSGLNRDIPDFSGRIVEPYSILSGSSVWPAWQDTYGHGSGVAAVAAAQGDDHLGIAGAAWNVKIMPVKIANSNSSDDVTIAAGITYAVDKGADVINVSFAGAESSRTMESAVDYALARGVVIVAAAGNNGTWSVGYPAAIPGVIAVGATDSANNRCSFSNQGSALDITAPGASILSYTVPSTTSFARWSGTSFSSPLVAGVMALLKSTDPGLTPAEIADILYDSADDLGASGWDQAFGWGLLDADEAVAEASGTVTTTTTTSTTTTSTTTTTTTTLPPTTSTTGPPPLTTSTTTTFTTIAGRFADVSEETTPYADQIEQLAGAGVVDGYTVGDHKEFRPDDLVKRQQFTKMIVLTLGYPVTESDTCTFADVAHTPGELYPYHYVAVATSKGITTGTKPPLHFSPYGQLTRAQMITMVVRATQLPDPPADYVSPFSNFSAVHYPYARRAAYAGLLDALDGAGPGYDFLAPATRGEVCALLAPLLQ